VSDAIVVLSNDARIAALQVSTKADTVVVHDYYTSRELHLPFRDVKRVYRSRPFEGVRPGVTNGIRVGVAAGVALGLFLGESNPDDAMASKPSAAIVFGGFGAFVGGAAGGLIGLTRSGSETYLFTTTPVDSTRTDASATPASEAGL